MKTLRLVLLAAGVALGVIAYRVQIHNLGAATTPARSWAIVIGAWLFLLAGLVAWSRRPSNRLGPLMAAAGIALLLRQLRYSHDAFLFTVFFVVGELSYWAVAYAVFSYPSGRITDRLERALIRVGYTLTFLFTIAILLLYDGSRPLRFFNSPRDSLIYVGGSGAAAITVQKAFVIVVWGFLAVVAILLLVRKLFLATPRARRILAPLLLAAITVGLRAVFEGIFTFAERPSAILYEYLFWWQISAFIALPLALLAGFLRARLARASVGDLVLELERTPPQGIRDALSRALDDPTLEVLFWLPEQNGFVDAAGRRAELPTDSNRTVTRLQHEGEPLAALVHDPSLLDEPKLVGAAGAAASLALENARLHAETRAQLEQVRESRVRIVETADEERRRIERDIHDGAQQRLVALAVQLRSAQRRLRDPEIDSLLAATVKELQVAVEELRELARGVHPAILTEDGLAAALESLVSRIPFPVDLDAAEGRLPAQVEATAYFVACEALANVVKHSGASTATVRTVRRNGLLVVEVEDDGVGGAVAGNGSGLRGLADRVEALGGRFRVESPAKGGTRIVGEIPMRVVVAEDSVLFREGLVRILVEGGFDVAAQAGDADALHRAVISAKPDVAILDVRMPPTQTDEGTRAARQIRERHPEVGLLVLSQVVEAKHAMELLSESPEGFGYLLKDRVIEIDDFLEAVRRVGRGGTAIDPEVVAQLFGRRRRQDPLEELTAREREVLSLMAEGRSNRGICEKLVLSPKTIESHVNNIFTKLRLGPAPDDHRRVLAVLAFLK